MSRTKSGDDPDATGAAARRQADQDRTQAQQERQAAQKERQAAQKERQAANQARAKERQAAQKEKQAANKARMKERQAATKERMSARREDSTIMREVMRETKAALRDAAKESQQGLRDAQLEAEGQAREARRSAADAKAEARQIKQSMLERAAAKVDEHLSQHLAEQEAAASRSARQAAKLERLAGFLGSLDVWTRTEPGERRPRFTRDEIAETAIRIADEEGLDALSMRYLAAELGAGTMTLYHYVRTKDELMTLVNDAVMAEVVVPADEPLPDDWREAVTVIARRTRAALERHPWIFDITDDPPFGPNSVRHFDQTMQAVSTFGGSLADRLDVVSSIDEYVFGHCLHLRNNGGDDDHLSDDLRQYMVSLIASGEYPHIAAVADELGFDEAWTKISDHLRDPDRFERNLSRLLDGFERGLEGPSRRR